MKPEIKQFIKEYSKYLYKARSELNIAYLQIHITQLCQNNCSHCYHKLKKKYRDKKNMMFIGDIKKIVSNFANFAKKKGKTPVFDLIGGDPLMHPDIWNIISFFKRYKYDVGIKGNPHLVEKNIFKLKKHGIKRYQLSLDGMENTNDLLRGYKNLFNMTISAIRLLQGNDIHPIIRYTVSKQNIAEVLPLQQYIHEKRLSCGFSIMRYISSDQKSLMVPITEYLNILRNHIELFGEHAIKDNTGYILFYKEHLLFPLLVESGFLEDNFVHSLIKRSTNISCNLFNDVYIVDVDGTLKLCQKDPRSIIGTSEQESMELTLESKKRYPFNIKFDYICEQCYYKNVCYGCPAFFYATAKSECPLFKVVK